MNVDLYIFPTLDDGYAAVEHVYCDLLNLKRNGATLDPEVIDWLDSANTWLQTEDTAK